MAVRIKGLMVEEVAGPDGIAIRTAGAIVGGVIVPADNETADHSGKIRGLAIEAAAGGATFKLQTYGPYRWPGGTFTAGLPIYIGTNGALTQVRPTNGRAWKFGHADAATKIFINPVEDFGDKSYRHQQLIAATTWTITHGLGKKPAVQVFDSGGAECFGEVEHVSDNQLTITFSAAFGGNAYLN